MLTLMSITVPLVIGVLALWLARAKDLRNIYKEPLRITWIEFIGGSALIVLIAVLTTVIIGPGLARDGAVSGYHEFYNGSVTESVVATTECHRDGSCNHHYTCDTEVIHIPATYGSKGELLSPGYDQIITHECPYATKELEYRLETNIGKSFTIADGYFEAHPEEWRSGHGIPGDVSRQPPDRWLRAKADLENGKSDPVTGVNDYDNFILASDSDLYKKYDGSIEALQKAGLLPEHTAKLGDDDMLFDYDMQATKVQAVGGLTLSNPSEWQTRLMRFDAALGSELQGDMHIVLVPASKVSDPDEYITALKAYWTKLGKWSISKNGIILAIGVSPDGKTVEWSRADTGMPIGNGTMISALKLRLHGEPFTPGVLLGNISTRVHKDGDELKVKYDLDETGLIGQVVFNDFPFERACMECTDDGDNGASYVALKEQVPITTGAKILMFVIVLFLSIALWGALLYFDPAKAIHELSEPPKPRDRW